MTGVDVEHTKAQWEERAQRLRATGEELMSKREIEAYIGGGFDAINVVAPALVVAVERVQALHTKSNQGYGEDDYCDCCGTIWPCLTIEALETP